MIDNNTTDSKIIHLTDAAFDVTIEVPSLVIVDFWAPWCGPCGALSPILEEVATAYDGQEFTICKMNIDDNMHTARRFGIRSIPTILIFKAGKLIEQIMGFTSKETLEEKINTLLSE